MSGNYVFGSISGSGKLEIHPNSQKKYQAYCFNGVTAGWMDSTVQFHPFLCHTKNSRTLETLIEMCHLIFMQCPGVLFYLLLTRSCFDFFTILYLFEFFELNWAVLYWKFFIESQLRCHNIGVPLNRIPYS